MADDTPAEIIKTKIIKIHKKSPTNTYPADDKKRKKAKRNCSRCSVEGRWQLDSYGFSELAAHHIWRGRVSTPLVSWSHRQTVIETEEKKKALMKRTLRSRPPLSHLAYTRQASIWSIKLSSCRWVSRLQQSINGKKKKHILLFFSSLLLQPPPPACETHSWISKQTEEEWNKVGWGRKKSVW